MADSLIRTFCVDGIVQISFLQHMIAGKKFAQCMANVRACSLHALGRVTKVPLTAVRANYGGHMIQKLHHFACPLKRPLGGDGKGLMYRLHTGGKMAMRGLICRCAG